MYLTGDAYLTQDPLDAAAFARRVGRVECERGIDNPGLVLGHPDAEGWWIVPLPGVRWPRVAIRYAARVLQLNVGGWLVMDPAEVEEFAAE